MAKTIRDEEIKLNIVINGDLAKKELFELETAQRKLRDVNKDLYAEKLKLERQGKKETEQYKELTAQLKSNNDAMKGNETRMKELRDQIGLTGLTFNQLARQARDLRFAINNMTPGSPERKRLEAELKTITARMQEINVGTKQAGFSIGKMADGFNKYFTMVTAGLATITGVVVGFKQLIQGAAQLSDKLADVRKTTGLSAEGVKQLAAELRTIDTRTSRNELLDLARIAGKLGVEGKDNIFGFVRAADQINVALAEDLGGNVEETIAKVGKLVDVFKVSDQYGLEQGLLKVGSAINSLGAASTANEEYLVDFTKRIGGVAMQADISIENILGLGATLDQLGQTAELSSTALMGIMVDMFKKPAEYAAIAKMSVKEFTDLLKTDANEAFIRLLAGLNGSNEGLTEMANKLDGLGVDGKRSISVLATLSQNTELLRKQQELSRQEFEKGTSLTNEFNIKNETLGATLAKIGKAMATMFISSPLMNGLNSMVKGFANLLGITESHSNALLTQRDNVNLLVIELTNANTEEARKKKIWDELKSLAPEILENINQENINTSLLTENLQLYNEQMVRKIALASSEEALAKERERVGKAISERLDTEQRLMGLMLGFQQKIGVYDEGRAAKLQEVLISNTDINEKYSQTLGLVQDFNKSQNNTEINLQEINNLAHYLYLNKQDELEAQEKLNEALKVYTDRYNILMSDVKKNVTGGGGTTPGGGEGGTGGGGGGVPGIIPTEKEIDASIDALEKLDEEIAKSFLFKDNSGEVMQSVIASVLGEIKEVQSFMQEFDVGPVDPFIKQIESREERLNLFYTNGQISETQYNNALKKLQKDRTSYEIRIEKELQLTKLNLIANTIGAAASLFKEGSIAYRIMASAEALINTYAGAAAAVAPPPTGLGPVLGPWLAAATIINGLSTVAKINAIQFASGKYDVIGASDGMSYSAGYAPYARTGIYGSPTLIGGLGLVAERAPELVVDGPTLSNIRMNAPGIIHAIQAMRVPQYASGNYPGQPSAGSGSGYDPEMINGLTVAINRLNEQLSRGISSKIIYSDIEETMTEVNNIKQSASK